MKIEHSKFEEQSAIHTICYVPKGFHQESLLRDRGVDPD